MNVRYRCLMLEHCMAGRHEFDQMMNDSGSLLPQITNTVNMNLSESCMWCIVAKDI